MLARSRVAEGVGRGPYRHRVEPDGERAYCLVQLGIHSAVAAGAHHGEREVVLDGWVNAASFAQPLCTTSASYVQQPSFVSVHERVGADS